ncbi:MAG: hypothetical protein ACF8SC_08305 [Phycisphaerales bacterium JB037]
MNARKKPIVLGSLAILGIAMIVIGAIGWLVPPILTGVGFLVLAWGLN